MSPTIRHNDALVTGEAERPRNARVWDRHVEYDDEPVREPIREPVRDARRAAPTIGDADHGQPPARVEPARPPLREAPPTPATAQRVDARRADRSAHHRVEPRATPARAGRTGRAVSIGRVLDQLSGISRRRPPIPFGISPDVWACLSVDTQRSFRALARRLRAVLR